MSVAYTDVDAHGVSIGWLLFSQIDAKEELESNLKLSCEDCKA